MRLRGIYRCAALFLPILLASPMQGQPADEVSVLEWEFDVFLNDKPIGSHEYRIIQEGPSITVETEASFDVKILFFTAYTYRHRNVETWDPRGLASIHAKTDANGKDYEVRGNREGDSFSVEVNGASQRLPAEIMTFAYWNPEILSEQRLLNSQTGEYESIEVIERGESTVNFEGNAIPSRRYDLIVKGKPVSVWYAQSDQRWLALESVAKGERLIRYLPAKLPDEAGTVITRFNNL